VQFWLNYLETWDPEEDALIDGGLDPNMEISGTIDLGSA
jgi:hypothetical protein